MKLLTAFVIFLLLSTSGYTQNPETPTFRLFLIGDAGEDDTTEATLRDLGVMLKKYPNSAVIFLGDNCYRHAAYGLLPFNVKGFDNSKIARQRMASQFNILKDYEGWAYFIPGNHDWWNYTNLHKGKKALMKEENYVESTLKNFKSLKNNGSTFLPDSGHPGPVVREFNGDRTRVIFLDSYRLILDEGRRRRDTLQLNAFYRNMRKALKEGIAKKQKIIVVAHHPIHAKGNHSIPLEAWQTMVKRFADANTNYPPYNRMATSLDSLLKEERRPDIFYISGHEHSLEYFNNDSLQYIVSGAGSKVDMVDYRETVLENEYFIWNQEGFFEIEFYGKYERIIIHHRKDINSKLEEHCLIGCNPPN